MRDALKAALSAGWKTGLLGVLGFVVAHSLLITPLAVNSEVPYPWRHLALLIGPLPIALPVGLLGGLAAGWAYDSARDASMRRGPRTRWPIGRVVGVAGAAALVPSLVAGLILGWGWLPTETPEGGTEEAPPQGLPSHAKFFLPLPPLVALGVGFWLGGWRASLGMLLSVGLAGFMLTPFIVATYLRGLAGIFLAVVIGIIAACGWVMDWLVARRQAKVETKPVANAAP